MSFFESIRRANPDFYTANPLAFLSADQRATLAEQQGMTVEGLKIHMTTPHVEMTCPLCGQASTHLVQCKGCGGDAWGFDYESAYGDDAITRLRAGVTCDFALHLPLFALRSWVLCSSPSNFALQ